VASGGDAEPVIEVRVNREIWHRVEHLHNSQSFDHHYVATSDENNLLWLHFGDGIRGKQVVARGPDARVEPAVIEIRYRVGTPIAGNCAAGTLRRCISPDDKAEAAQMAALGTVTLTNLVPGTGGTEPESTDAIRLAIPASLGHGALQRAVTLRDYATIAQSVPGVSRAVARALGGPFNTVLVLVDPEDQAELSDALAAEVHRAIEAARMAGREHRVVQARPVPLDVELLLWVEPGEPKHQVREAVHAALRPGDDASPGFFHPDRLTIGQAVEQGDLIAAVQRVPGVRSATVQTFRRRAPGAPVKSPRIELSTYELARLDADDSFPENGTLHVRVAGIDGPQDFDVVEAIS
jgi:predicted phage baseplate assembly protein